MEDCKHYIAKYKEFLKNNIGLWCWIVWWVLFTYGMKIFFYSMTVDSEVAHLNKDNVIWVALGRWGITFLKNLTGSIGNFAPFAAHFLGACSLVLAVIIWSLNIADAKDDYSKAGGAEYAFAAIYISYPMYATLFNFSIVSFESSLGILLCAAGVLAVNLSMKVIEKTEKVICFVIGVLLSGLAVSIYQSFIALIIVGFAVTLLLFDERSRVEIRKVLVDIAAVGLSVLFYAITSIIGKRFTEIQSHLEGQYIGWGVLPVRTVITNLLNYFGNLLFFDSEYTKCCGHILFASLIIFFIYAIYMLWNKKGLACSLCLAILGGIFYVPFLLGSSMPVRSQLVAPLVVAFAGWLLMKKMRRISVILFIFLLVISMRNSFTVNKLYYGDYMKYRHDEMMVEKISDRIEQLGMGEIPNKPVVVLGSYQPRDNATTMTLDEIGKSIFLWNSPDRNAALLNIYGYPYRRATYEETIKAIELSYNLPNYPEEGYISDLGEIIVVKLGDDMPIGYVDKQELYANVDYIYQNLPVDAERCSLMVDFPQTVDDSKILITKDSQETEISGWAIDSYTDSCVEEVFALLGEVYYICEKTRRTDLARNNEAFYYAGYTFYIPTEKLAENEEITFIALASDCSSVYEKTYQIVSE